MPTTTDVTVMYPRYSPLPMMLVVVVGAIVAAIVVFVAAIQIRSRCFRKGELCVLFALCDEKLRLFSGAPRLVAIENPDRIPPMTRMEEPTLWDGVRWGGDGRPQNRHLDLQWELQQDE